MWLYAGWRRWLRAPRQRSGWIILYKIPYIINQKTDLRETVNGKKSANTAVNTLSTKHGKTGCIQANNNLETITNM